MAVISFSSGNDWFVPRHEFRRLLEHAASGLGDPHASRLERAIYLDGLHFKRLEPQEIDVIVPALHRAIDCLRGEIRAAPDVDQREREFETALAELAALLRELQPDSSPP